MEIRQETVKEKLGYWLNVLGLMAIVGSIAVMVRYSEGCAVPILYCRVPFNYGSPHLLVWFMILALGVFASVVELNLKGFKGLVVIAVVLNFHEGIFNLFFLYSYPQDLVDVVKNPFVGLLVLSNFVILPALLMYRGMMKRVFDMRRFWLGWIGFGVFMWLWTLAGFDVTVTGIVGKTLYYFDPNVNGVEVMSWLYACIVTAASVRIDPKVVEGNIRKVVSSVPKGSSRRVIVKGKGGIVGENRIEGVSPRSAERSARVAALCSGDLN